MKCIVNLFYTILFFSFKYTQVKPNLYLLQNFNTILARLYFTILNESYIMRPICLWHFT